MASLKYGATVLLPGNLPVTSSEVALQILSTVQHCIVKDCMVTCNSGGKSKIRTVIIKRDLPVRSRYRLLDVAGKSHLPLRSRYK